MIHVKKKERNRTQTDAGSMGKTIFRARGRGSGHPCREKSSPPPIGAPRTCGRGGARHRETMGGTVQTPQNVHICRSLKIHGNDAEGEGEAGKEEEAVAAVASEGLQCARAQVPRTRMASAETTKAGSHTGAGAAAEKSVAADDASAAAVPQSYTSWSLAYPPTHGAARPSVQVHPSSSATPTPARGTVVHSGVQSSRSVGRTGGCRHNAEPRVAKACPWVSPGCPCSECVHA